MLQVLVEVIIIDQPHVVAMGMEKLISCSISKIAFCIYCYIAGFLTFIFLRFCLVMNYEESIEWLNTIPLSFDRKNKNYEFKLDGIKTFLSHLKDTIKLKDYSCWWNKWKRFYVFCYFICITKSGFKIGAFTSPTLKIFVKNSEWKRFY